VLSICFCYWLRIINCEAVEAVYFVGLLAILKLVSLTCRHLYKYKSNIGIAIWKTYLKFQSKYILISFILQTSFRENSIIDLREYTKCYYIICVFCQIAAPPAMCVKYSGEHVSVHEDISRTELRGDTSPNSLCVLAVVLAPSSCDGVAICHCVLTLKSKGQRSRSQMYLMLCTVKCRSSFYRTMPYASVLHAVVVCLYLYRDW